MQPFRCRVFRGLPKEVEEDVNKFLEVSPCQVQHVVQSESDNHVTITLFFELVPRDEV